MVTAESGSTVNKNKEVIWRSDGNYMVNNCIEHDETDFCSACFKSGQIQVVYHISY
ncbi:hypothetical protein DPMN_051986 [Dreissena polymorpha]|uniref:Uncharacterized protein n=1 Tax=Dreissena polymorpha TaxID=45954 RepID=A0A9D4HPH0_DREPO|nr:hypothetical protein DPMN_051986 [Dreissena polymorpha]